MPRLVISGVWGLLFLVPIWKMAYYKKGLVIAMIQAIFMLIVFFPRMGFGMFGLQAGSSAPLFVIVFTAFWGIAAALFLKTMRL